MNKKLTFFQMMYCWMFVYLSFFKYKRDTPAYYSCTMLSNCRVLNVMCISALLNLLFDFSSKIGKGMTGPFMIWNIIIIIGIYFIDHYLFFRRRNKLFGIFMDYPQKEKLRGRTHFWLYIAVTVLLFGLTTYLTQVIEKPLLTV